MNRLDFLSKLFDISGRVALVTGATGGLGRVAALTLARAGADVGLCSRNGKDASALALEIARTTGRKSFGMSANVAKKADMTRLVARVEKQLGPVDILIACAGINIRKDTPLLTEADWDAVVDTNLKGSFLAAQAVLPSMRKRKWGRIVFLGSMVSLVSIPGRAAYASSKAAILGLTRTLALEAATDGVCVNAICPGPFRTAMNLPLLRSRAKNREFLRKVPMGRWAEPRELTGLLLYLSSPACSFMTGSGVVIDGGWTAQ